MWRTREQSDASKEDQPTRHPKDESDRMSHPSVGNLPSQMQTTLYRGLVKGNHESSCFLQSKSQVAAYEIYDDSNPGKGRKAIEGRTSPYSFIRGKAGHIPQGQSQLHQAGGLLSFGWTMS